MNRKEFYESLSEDVKTKIRACKNEQEMLKVLEEESIELDPELLEGISGGNQNDYWESSKCDNYESCL